MKRSRILRTRKRGTAIEQEERHPAPHALVISAHLLLDLPPTRGIPQRGLHLRPVHPARRGDGRRALRVGVHPVGEVPPKERLLHLVLPRGAPHLQRVVEQRVRHEGVGRPIGPPGEVDAHGGAGGPQARPDAGVVGSVRRLRHALRRRVGAELVRPPDDVGVDGLAVGRERRLKLALPDPAPGSGKVADDLD